MQGGIPTSMEEIGESKLLEEEEKHEMKQEATTSEGSRQASLTRRDERQSIDKLPVVIGNNIWAATGLEKLKVKRTSKIHKR